ncbi:MAG: hypothetical protein IJ188_08460 [Clostridia bacterium]|nr:hypothetical protein [Clostridia bacterium]
MKRVFVFVITMLLVLTVVIGALAETPMRQMDDCIVELVSLVPAVIKPGHFYEKTDETDVVQSFSQKRNINRSFPVYNSEGPNRG